MREEEGKIEWSEQNLNKQFRNERYEDALASKKKKKSVTRGLVAVFVNNKPFNKSGTSVLLNSLYSPIQRLFFSSYLQLSCVPLTKQNCFYPILGFVG